MLRTLAAMTALIMGLLLAVTAWYAATGNSLVMPTNGVIGTRIVDDPAEGREGYGRLVERTELQRWRAVSGPGPEGGNPEPVISRPDDAVGSDPVASPNGEQLVRNWLDARDRQEDLLQPPRRIEGVSSLPGPVKDVFEQPEGRTWRNIHDRWLLFGGGFYLLGMLAALAAFLSWRGRVEVQEGFSGKTLPRFNALERTNHWMTATSFVILALTGLIILYGKYLVRPLMGAEAFADLTSGSAWVHMTMILPFTLGLAVMIAAWTWQNLPAKVDWAWLKRGGGMLWEEPPPIPAARFNAGQKLIFWAVVLGGISLIVTGIGLMFPFLWAGYDGMLIAQSLHSAAALIMIGIIFAHIYIGTVGMEGAIDAMWKGRVDRNWAKEHHSLWYERLTGRDAREDMHVPGE